MLSAWYNFKTDQYERIDTPQDFHDYIPQLPAAQGLYDVYIAMGDEPIEAFCKVLHAVVGDPVK